MNEKLNIWRKGSLLMKCIQSIPFAELGIIHDTSLYLRVKNSEIISEISVIHIVFHC